MLPGTPSHTTATPRSRSTFATASAGNTWPPVPPAMMSTGPLAAAFAAPVFAAPVFAAPVFAARVFIGSLPVGA